MYMLNCREVSPDGRLLDGLAESRLRGSERFGLLFGNVRVRYECNPHAGRSLPTIQGGRVRSAQAATHHGRPVLIGIGGWTSAILRVSTFHLSFREGISTHLPVTNSWAGAESLRASFVQVGQRSAIDQHQLIVIPNHSLAFVADRDSRYITVGWRDGEWYSRPTNAEEFARYLVLRAELLLKKRKMDVKGLKWTRHNVCSALNCPRLWPHSLEEETVRVETPTPRRRTEHRTMSARY